MKYEAVKEGYKMTEVGMIPEDWKLDIIKNIAQITTGNRNTQDKIDDGIYPFFVRSATVEKINSYSYDGEAVLTAGDGVGTGKIYHYIKGKFDFHQRVYKISEFSPEINGYFFFFYFSKNFYNRIIAMTAKSSVDSVRLEMIANMSIPLPPLPEQTAIAEALSDTDALIASLDKLIAKKKDIKQAAMQELLTGKRRLPGFDGEWKEKNLGEIGSFSKGRGIKKDDVVDDGLPCIRYGEIYTHHNDYLRDFYSYIPKDIASDSQIIKFGDILFAGSGETSEDIGKCVAYLKHEIAYAGGDIVIFTPNGQNPKYLGYLLNHPTISCQKSRMGQGDAIVHISAKNLAKLFFNLPPLPEQTAIAEILSDMDEEIGKLEQKRDKVREIKEGMMQELLTGRIRLV